MNNKVILILLALAVVQASTTEVNICSTGAMDSTSVTITNCAKGPCTLRRGSTASVSLRFTPDTDVTSLSVDVKATIFFLTLGFPGVDGTAVCGKIFKASDDSVAPCPLRAGVEYIYKDSFAISRFYPPVSTTVTWALKSGSATIKCFRVGVRIG